ncbi:MAG: HdeD family acid-resistance protein [Gammaproteobacteria bacterium]
MADTLKSLWLMPTLRGVLAILFGIILFAYPGLSLVFMVALFGAFVMVSGIFTLVMGFTRRHYDGMWKTYIADGVISIIIGLLVWLWPAISSMLLVYFIAAWALIGGIMQIISALRLRSFFPSIWVSLLMGILLVVFGIAVFIHPGAGAVAISLVIGIVAIVYGVMAITFGLQLRKAVKV